MDLKSFFEPKSILIIGASRSEFTFNWTLVKNLREARYKGKLYILHPKADEILGVTCYKKLEELPEVPDLAIFIRIKNIIEYIKVMAEFGIKNYMIESDISIDFDSKKVLADLKKYAEENNLKIMGPSMIGIINTDNFFTSSIIPIRRHVIQNHKRFKGKNNGSLSFIAQSGGLSGALGWWNPSQNIPISKIIHTGKAITIKDSDVMQYLFDDPNTKVISIYLKNPTEDFIKCLEKNSQIKPVLFKFVGKDLETLERIKKTCAIEVKNYIELFEFAKVFLWCPEPTGNSLGIIGPSSGAIHLLIAEMRIHDLHLARLNPMTKQRILQKVGGSTCLEGNPVDYWPPKKFVGTDICSIYYRSSNLLLKDETVDALFLALEFFSEIEFDFEIFSEIKEKYPDKPIITVLIQAEKEGRERIKSCATKLRIPVFEDEIERSIRAYAAFLRFYEMKKNKTNCEK